MDDAVGELLRWGDVQEWSIGLFRFVGGLLVVGLNDGSDFEAPISLELEAHVVGGVGAALVLFAFFESVHVAFVG